MDSDTISISSEQVRPFTVDLNLYLGYLLVILFCLEAIGSPRPQATGFLVLQGIKYTGTELLKFTSDFTFTYFQHF